MLAATPKLMFSNGAGETTVRELRSIYDLLDVVRPRPGMYIGDNSILALRSFLSGFDVGLLSLDAWLAEGEPPFGDFHDWVAARNGLRESTLGWANILLRATGREDTALIRFFEELVLRHGFGDPFR